MFKLREEEKKVCPVQCVCEYIYAVREENSAVGSVNCLRVYRSIDRQEKEGWGKGHGAGQRQEEDVPPGRQSAQVEEVRGRQVRSERCEVG